MARHSSNDFASAGGIVLLEDVALERVVARRGVPVEVRPAFGLHPLGGLGNRLRAELGDEPTEAGPAPDVRGEPAEIAVVPAEVEVRVGPRLGDAGQHAAVSHDRPGAVAPAEGARDGAVEHFLAPRRQARVAANFSSAPRDHGSPGSRSAANGALCAHHRNTLGW